MFQSMYKRYVDGVAFLLMPDWSAGAGVSQASVNFEFLCAGGDRASVNIDGVNGDMLTATVAALRGAIAALTNAVPVSQSLTSAQRAPLGVDNPLDESYSSAGMKMVLQFQNALLELKSIAIPAPDEQYFGPDGVTVVTPDSGATAGSAPELLDNAITAILSAINTGGGTFAYIGGYRVERSRRTVRPRVVRASVEPAVGQNPGDEPGEPI